MIIPQCRYSDQDIALIMRALALILESRVTTHGVRDELLERADQLDPQATGGQAAGDDTHISASRGRRWS
jgi:hypothetical protein